MDDRRELLPSKALFYRGAIPEPLTGEERQWLVEQLHHFPKRVNDARTCSIGALTDMATTEFCRMMAEREALTPKGGDGLREALEEARRVLTVQRNDLLGRGYSRHDDEVANIDEVIAKLDAALSAGSQLT